MKRLTPEQFDALAELIRMRTSPSAAAARLVIVDGCTRSDAALATGLTAQAVSNAIGRITHALELAEKATTPPA